MLQYHSYSTDPWKNFGRGLAGSSELYQIGASIYAVLQTLAVAGCVIAMVVAFIMMAISPRKKREAGDAFMKACLRIILICMVPGILTLAANIATMLVK